MKPASIKPVRCAIYTRVSTEQGLDQEFKVAGWTGGNERTVKNWISGRYAPCGRHLVVLAHPSDQGLTKCHFFDGPSAGAGFFAANQKISAQTWLCFPPTTRTP